MNKRTVILGASTNPERYSYIATVRLKASGHTVFPVGIKGGDIEGEAILVGKPAIENVDTITLYVGSQNQKEWYDYILSLKPKRIIFNPGTENDELVQLAKAKGIESEVACTLVLLSIDKY